MITADTHILAWYLAGNTNRLPEWGFDLIESSIMDCSLLISALTVYEMGVILKKNRVDINIPVKDLFDGLADAGAVIVPVDYTIALVADSFDNIHLDPFDRMIAATAIANNAPLITADRKLFGYPLEIIRV